MKTITIHVSEDTAKALEIDKGRLERAEKFLRGQLMMLEAHSNYSTIPTIELDNQIEVTQGAIDLCQIVMRFQHDVMAAYRCAAAEVE